MEEEQILTTQKEEKPFKAFVRSQIYFLKLIYKEYPKSFLLFGLLVLLSSICPPLIVLVNKETIDRISTINGDSNAFKYALFFLLIYFILNYATAIFTEIENYIFTKISITVNYVLKALMSKKLIQIPLKEFENSVFYDSMKLADMAIGGNCIRVIQNLIYVVGSIISLVGIFGILLTIHWSLPFALFLSTLPGILLAFWSKIKGYHMEKDISEKEREMHFTDTLFTDKRSLKEIKIYNLGNYLLNKWKVLFKYTQDKKMSLALWELKSRSFAAFVLQVASMGVSVFLVYQIFDAKLSIGSYVALLTAVTTVQGLFGTIGGNLGTIFETAIYNNALLSILNYSENKKENSHLIKINNIENITLKNASFCYPNSSTKVLDNVSLKINKGDNISIVGYNGSGKTTLAYCILGLFDLEEGELKVNNNVVHTIDINSFLSKTSAIFQDFMRYKYSIRENIGFGDLSKLYNDNEIYEVLKKVGLDSKLSNYVDGLDTYLTKELPNGTELSGGEWQKIALARAFMKESDLIILDEPTAALDPISELKVFETFYRLSKNKTTLTISHRIGPTKRSDLIIVMDKGKVVEQGTFEELINNQGLFYKMYESQSVWYKDDLLKSKEISSVLV
ncbi:MULTISPECIES: ABC transporter ATP-binding protein [Bacillus]|nr:MULTISPECIES: ABC transporter ATP-binding protein [Bacillus cereus group]QWG77732.1 ABC transporter ATP-binding protein [Bacillus mycoides]TXR80246.1 ABC transporter ATP-binding protein [Bacillus sp. AR13-1]